MHGVYGIYWNIFCGVLKRYQSLFTLGWLSVFAIECACLRSLLLGLWVIGIPRRYWFVLFLHGVIDLLSDGLYVMSLYSSGVLLVVSFEGQNGALTLIE
jgi:hypothetical protein